MNKKLTPTEQDVLDTIVVIMLAIIAALVALCLTVYTSKAMSNDMPTVAHYGGCTPYTHSMVLSSVTGYSHTAMLQHSACDGQAVTQKSVQRRTVTNKGTTEATVTVTTEDKPKDKPTVEHSNTGNPGNTKDVGHAGEDPNGKGTMPKDNAGGDGNGEHGNQGQGGHN